MRGKGRVTIQFGCCYNYAVDREGRQPGDPPSQVVLKTLYFAYKHIFGTLRCVHIERCAYSRTALVQGSG